MSIYIHMCIYIYAYLSTRICGHKYIYLQCIILCVAGSVAVYDALYCVAVCVAGCVARWCCLCIASAAGCVARCVAGCVAVGAE